MKTSAQMPWAWLAMGAALVASVMVGCGGGVGTGGTGTFTYGPVTGFGSVIVSGIRFDESQARIEDDAGDGRTRDVLKLGMMVAIESDAVSTDASGRLATANVVRFGSVLLGPVASVTTESSTLLALGQTVRTTATTVFDDGLGGLASIQPGNVIEVHGFIDAATQTVVATRVERGPVPTPFYKVRGVVTDLSASAKTLRIGAATFDFSNATNVPADLANGQLLTIRTPTTAVAGNLVASSFGSVRLNQPPGDRDEADIRGVITAFTSTSRFVLNDTPVDATSATFEDGTAGVVLGARVKVEGRFVGGVLIAREVETESDSNPRDTEIELRGAIESVNASNTTFRLRGNTVFYGGSGVRFENGTAADLTVGRQVEAKGRLSADRTVVQAERIKF